MCGTLRVFANWLFHNSSNIFVDTTRNITIGTSKLFCTPFKPINFAPFHVFTSVYICFNDLHYHWCNFRCHRNTLSNGLSHLRGRVIDRVIITARLNASLDMLSAATDWLRLWIENTAKLALEQIA